MEHRGPATGETLHRGEAMCLRRPDRQQVTRLHPIGSTKGHHPLGDVEPEHGTDLATSHRGQGRMADSHVHRRVIRVCVLDQHEVRHTQEDKESTVTV